MSSPRGGALCEPLAAGPARAVPGSAIENPIYNPCRVIKRNLAGPLLELAAKMPVVAVTPVPSILD